MKEINVTIKFMGNIASLMDLKELRTSIRADRHHALADIKNIIRTKAGDQVIFTILVGGASIDLCTKDVFEEQEIFSVIPVVLGG